MIGSPVTYTSGGAVLSVAVTPAGALPVTGSVKPAASGCSINPDTAGNAGAGGTATDCRVGEPRAAPALSAGIALVSAFGPESRAPSAHAAPGRVSDTATAAKHKALFGCIGARAVVRSNPIEGKPDKSMAYCVYLTFLHMLFGARPGMQEAGPGASPGPGDLTLFAHACARMKTALDTTRPTGKGPVRRACASRVRGSFDP